MTINIDWTNFKSFVTARNLSIQYVDVNGYYYLMIFDGQFSLNCHLNKDGGSDVTDFETNFKAAGNQGVSTNVIIKDSSHNNFIGQKTKANSVPVAIASDQGLSVNLSNISTIGTRTFIGANQENISATTTIRTVTAGKTFYMTGYTISSVNTSVLNNARLAIRDNNTVRIPFVMPTAVLGLVSPGFSQAQTFELNPVPFTTNVNLQIIAGTCNVSVAIVGYEE